MLYYICYFENYEKIHLFKKSDFNENLYIDM